MGYLLCLGHTEGGSDRPVQDVLYAMIITPSATLQSGSEALVVDDNQFRTVAPRLEHS